MGRTGRRAEGSKPNPKEDQKVSRRVKLYDSNSARLYDSNIARLFNAEDLGGGGGASPPENQDNPPKDDGDKNDGDNQGDPPKDGDVDWKKRFEAQRQVNKNLSDTVAQMKDGMKAALGITDKKSDANDLVETLQNDLAEMRLENLVNKIARENNITDAGDVALLFGLKDEVAMRSLAKRLAPAGDGSDSGSPKPRVPRPDGSRGRGGNGEKTVSATTSMQEHLKALQAADSKQLA